MPKPVLAAAVLVSLFATVIAAPAQPAAPAASQPWMNRALPPDARADLVVKAMTHDEKLLLVMGTSQRPDGDPVGVAGYVPGIPRLGIPALRESNAELGVGIPLDGKKPQPEDEATALPSGLATAASWNPVIAEANGAMIGAEARRKGFNVLLAGAVNLARDPRDGRNFEYAGEDPLLAGTMVGASIAGIQRNHIVSTIKHFALNDQETNRTLVDAKIDPGAFHESDLLAFELANERGKPGAVMCSYNLINSVYACEDDWLLSDVLRGQWHFGGWVMSDWGAVHSTVAAAKAGLDQESGADWDSTYYFGGDLLGAALSQMALPDARLDEMSRRILRAMFASGMVDDPPGFAPLDTDAGARVAQRAEEEGIVVLRNEHHVLPLSPQLKRIAVIGGYADIGVMSGGGSSQVIPVGGPALSDDFNHSVPFAMILDPSSPLHAIAVKAPRAQVMFANGFDDQAAASLAKSADVAIVFATQWQMEGHDADDLSLPNHQDDLIAAVTAANPHTVVVLETGDPILMPWHDQAAAILEAWYPGQRGGEAIANVLFGAVNPSGHLPLTFPASAAQLPRPTVPGQDDEALSVFPVDYTEGAAVGYKWFTARHATPLYPFGFGLSYTDFGFSGLHVSGGKTITARFTVTNTGKRAGAAVPQLYADVMQVNGQPIRRLIGWQKVTLAPGDSRTVTVTADPRLLAFFDETHRDWTIAAGKITVMLGTSASDMTATARAALVAQTLAP